MKFWTLPADAGWSWLGINVNEEASLDDMTQVLRALESHPSCELRALKHGVLVTARFRVRADDVDAITNTYHLGMLPAERVIANLRAWENRVWGDAHSAGYGNCPHCHRPAKAVWSPEVWLCEHCDRLIRWDVRYRVRLPDYEYLVASESDARAHGTVTAEYTMPDLLEGYAPGFNRKGA